MFQVKRDDDGAFRQEHRTKKNKRDERKGRETEINTVMFLLGLIKCSTYCVFRLFSIFRARNAASVNKRYGGREIRADPIHDERPGFPANKYKQKIEANHCYSPFGIMAGVNGKIDFLIMEVLFKNTNIIFSFSLSFLTSSAMYRPSHTINGAAFIQFIRCGRILASILSDAPCACVLCDAIFLFHSVMNLQTIATMSISLKGGGGLTLMAHTHTHTAQCRLQINK